MGTDTKTKNLIRSGQVSSINQKTGAVKVTFSDKDDMLSAELPVLNRGSANNKDYWLPDIGEQVVCIFAPNSKNLSCGWVLGSYFSETAPPQVADNDIRRMDFSDGTYVEYNRATHELNINCVGTIKINGSKIYLNEG